MTIYEHSLISVRKFGGSIDWYTPIHSFMDSSKYYYPLPKHRVLLHHTYGAQLAVNKFGQYLPNGVLVRDVAYAHIKEDHGKVVTLVDWWRGTDNDCVTLSEFSKRLYNTDFGINNNIYYFDKEYRLTNTYIDITIAQDFIDSIKLRERWTYTPDLKESQWLKSNERYELEHYLNKS